MYTKQMANLLYIGHLTTIWTWRWYPFSTKLSHVLQGVIHSTHANRSSYISETCLKLTRLRRSRGIWNHLKYEIRHPLWKSLHSCLPDIFANNIAAESCWLKFIEQTFYHLKVRNPNVHVLLHEPPQIARAHFGFFVKSISTFRIWLSIEVILISQSVFVTKYCDFITKKST